MLEKSDISSQGFIDKMEAKYPDVLFDNTIDHIDHLYDSIHQADCMWNSTADRITHRKRRSGDTTSGIGDEDVIADDARLNSAHAHSVWEDIAHGLHKASIAILAILFLEVMYTYLEKRNET